MNIKPNTLPISLQGTPPAPYAKGRKGAAPKANKSKARPCLYVAREAYIPFPRYRGSAC